MLTYGLADFVAYRLGPVDDTLLAKFVVSPLQPGQRHPLDKVALAQGKEQQHGDDHQRREGHHIVGVGQLTGAAAQGVEPHGQRAQIGATGQVDQRGEKVIPRIAEGKDGDGGQGRLGEGHDNAPPDAKVATAVNARRVGKFIGNAHKELTQEKDKEGVAPQEVGHRHGQKGVDPAQLAIDHIERNQAHHIGHHERAQQQDKEGVTAGKPGAGKAIGHKRAGDHRPNYIGRHNDHGIAQPQAHRRRIKDGQIVLPHHRGGNPFRRPDANLLHGLERGRDGPRQRYQHHDGTGQEEEMEQCAIEEVVVAI